MPTVTSFWISPSRGGRDSRHDALARQTSLQVFKIISVKDPCSLTLTLGTWRARGLLAWRLKSSGHTEANLDMHPHTPLSLAYHSSLHQIATTLQQRLLLVQQEHTHSPRTCCDGQLPVCLNVCRPTVCTLAGRRLSVLRLHPDYTYAVCLHLVCRLFSPDFCLNVRRAAINNRHHALHSASPSCGRRHRLGYTYCSSQGLFRER